MDMTIDEHDGITRISLVGKLDIVGAEIIDVKFSAAASHASKAAVDLSGVDYIASMGIRVLVMAGKSVARRGGKIVLFGVSDAVTKVLSAAGLTEIIPVVTDWNSAKVALA